MFCSNCGKEVRDNDNFCGNCSTALQQPNVKNERDINLKNNTDYNKFAFWISVVSVVFIFLAFMKEIMYAGIALGLISLIMIILTLRRNKKEDLRNSRDFYTLTLSIVGIISNSMWLLFVLTILPNL